LKKKQSSKNNLSSVVTTLTSRNSQRLSQTINYNDFKKYLVSRDTKTHLPTIMDDKVKEGYLVIQELDSNSNRKQWKRYYFYVCNDEMSYYTNNSKSEEKGKIKLNNCKVKRADSQTTKPNSFIITCENQIQYSFFADDEEKCQSWISHIEGIVKQ